MLILIVSVTAAALLGGAMLGASGRLPGWLDGFLLAVAGGALIQALMADLIEPSLEKIRLIELLFTVGAGAALFTLADYLLDEVMGPTAGIGLVLAITLDGVPENLALGTVLHGGAGAAAAFTGAIALSNLPEAAGGARQMHDRGWSRRRILWLWTAVAVLLALAAILGAVALQGLEDEAMAIVQCFAAGAIAASLATEVFPMAFREDSYLSGIAVAAGLLISVALGTLAS